MKKILILIIVIAAAQLFSNALVKIYSFVPAAYHQGSNHDIAISDSRLGNKQPRALLIMEAEGSHGEWSNWNPSPISPNGPTE